MNLFVLWRRPGDGALELITAPLDGTILPGVTRDSILALARSFGLKVITEGVETQAQLDWLRAHGCDEAQGFFLARPLPFDEMLAKLADGQTVYSYRYKGEPRTQIGLLAQEVERLHPKAVRTHPSGFKMVNYAAATAPATISSIGRAASARTTSPSRARVAVTVHRRMTGKYCA